MLATEPPKVEVTTPAGEFQLIAGKLRFEFSAAASTGPGIALATLENGVGRDGVGVVAWQEFKGAPHQVQGSDRNFEDLPWSRRPLEIARIRYGGKYDGGADQFEGARRRSRSSAFHSSPSSPSEGWGRRSPSPVMLLCPEILTTIGILAMEPQQLGSL